MLKKIWKKTMNSAVVFNNLLIDNFRCESKYAKIGPENADNFRCTIEEQHYENKRHTALFERKLFNFGSRVSLSKKKNRVSSML